MATLVAYTILALPVYILAANALTCTDLALIECVPVPDIDSRISTQGLQCLEDSLSHMPPHRSHGCPEDHLPCCQPDNNTATGDAIVPSPPIMWHVTAIFIGCFLMACVLLCCYNKCVIKPLLAEGAVDTVEVVTEAQIEEHFPKVLIEGQPQCVVCLCEIQGMGRKLQCGHYFHADCITGWWTHTPRAVIECPTCKMIQSLPAMTKSAQVESSEVAARCLGVPADTHSEIAERGLGVPADTHSEELAGSGLGVPADTHSNDIEVLV